MTAYIARAPLRISFGGGGTDLAAYYTAFGGCVLSTTITRYCHVLAEETYNENILISSGDYNCSVEFPIDSPAPPDAPLALPRAVVSWFIEQGLLQRGVRLFLSSDVPPGSGLGSSSAMAVALLRALAAFTGLPLSPSAAADLACRIEIERLALPIGKQDQYASAYGGLNRISFTADTVEVHSLSLPPRIVFELEARLLLFSTGRTRSSAQILHQQRSDTHSKPEVIAGLHRIKALAEEMRAALEACEIDHFGSLLDHSWQEKRRLSTQISSNTIDSWYDGARSAGALGGKIAGAGGGGFMLLYCPLEHQAALRATMTDYGLRELPFGFERSGAYVLS